DDLVRILVEPKNSLTRQYQHLLSLDNVELEFDSSSLEAAADLALARGTGARGLRSIIEKCLLEVMFEVPSIDRIRRVVVTANVVNGEAMPDIFDKDGNQLAWDEDGHSVDPAQPAA
ncbi:MAG: hypothetical protein AAFV93_07325, partial [Chloroflexota bacterium]